MKYTSGYLINLLYSGNSDLDDIIDSQSHRVLKHYDGVVVCLHGDNSDVLDDICDNKGINYNYLDPTEASDLGIYYSSVETSGDIYWFEKVCA